MDGEMFQFAWFETVLVNPYETTFNKSLKIYRRSNSTRIASNSFITTTFKNTGC